MGRINQRMEQEGEGMSTSDRILELLEDRDDGMSVLELYQAIYNRNPNGKVGKTPDYARLSRSLLRMTGYYVTRYWGVCPVTGKQCFIYRRLRR